MMFQATEIPQDVLTGTMTGWQDDELIAARLR